jgi:alpha-tubulin suppressor-like RCC1 family protein
MLSLNNRIKLSLLVVQILIMQNIFSLQFGDGTDTDSLSPVKVADNVESVSAAGFITLIVKSDGTLWGTGDHINEAGEFGNAVRSSVNTFVKMMDDVKQVLSDCDVIKKDNSLWTVWDGIRKVGDDVVKGSGSFYIKKDGSLWVSGKDRHGRFGNGKVESEIEEPVKIRDNVSDVFDSGYYCAIVTKKGEMLISGENYLPAPYNSHPLYFMHVADNVRSVADGFYITKDDSLYAFGYAYTGCLGVGKKAGQIPPTWVMDNVKCVSSNTNYSFILTLDGTLYGCGGDTPNYFGALGTGDLKPHDTPIELMKGVKTISAGNYHSAIIKEDNTLWMCGSNDIPAAQ